MIKLQTSIKPLTVAITSAILFASLSTNAELIIDANAVKVDYPVQQSMQQWLIDKDEYALNPVNIRAGTHPDRSDPNDGPYDVVYIFPDELSANTWWNGEGSPPDGIPEEAVAFVHWELDNESGTFPGIMAKTDVVTSVDNFKSRNCIMAAGATIPQKGEPDGIEKNCNNPQGSSKRFKMNVLKPDVPIDMVYNLTPQQLTFNNLVDADEDGIDDLPTYDIPGDIPDAGPIEEAGRIYRVLQKWHNATGMDTATTPRDGVRMVGFKVELGHGVGDVAVPGSTLPTFTAITGPNGSGLLPNKTLGFELRPCMADAFFDVSRGQPGDPKNDCAGVYDGGGDPLTDQKLPQEIWLEEEYGTTSPKMYSFTDDKRMVGIGIPGGFWDKRPAGNYPPATQEIGEIDSGTAASDSPTYWDSRVDGATALPGYTGATTPNYFDLKKSQAADSTDVLNINEPPPFGYMMYFGVLSAGDTGNLSQGIYRDDDGDPSSEGDLIAWWDGDEYRWGIDGEVFDGEVTPEEKFAVVDTNLLKEWALYPLPEESNTELYPDGGFPPGPLYETGLMDDLAGLNVDYWVYLGKDFDSSPTTGETTFTIRLTAQSTTDAGVALNDYGNMTQEWENTPAPDLGTFIDADGIINITEPAYADEPLHIVLGDSDASPTGEAPTVVVTNDDTSESESVTLTKDPDLSWKFSALLPTNVVPTAGASNDGSLNVWPNQTVTVTYVDLWDGTTANVTKTDSVVIQSGLPDDAPPPSEDSSGCSCSTSPDGRIDPILPAAVLFALGYLGLRRWENKRK